MKLLVKAYQIQSTHPRVLNFLANHFFYKGELQKVENLATTAFKNTEVSPAVSLLLSIARTSVDCWCKPFNLMCFQRWLKLGLRACTCWAGLGKCKKTTPQHMNITVPLHACGRRSHLHNMGLARRACIRRILTQVLREGAHRWVLNKKRTQWSGMKWRWFPLPPWWTSQVVYYFLEVFYTKKPHM